MTYVHGQPRAAEVQVRVCVSVQQAPRNNQDNYLLLWMNVSDEGMAKWVGQENKILTASSSISSAKTVCAHTNDPWATIATWSGDDPRSPCTS